MTKEYFFEVLKCFIGFLVCLCIQQVKMKKLCVGYETGDIVSAHANFILRSCFSQRNSSLKIPNIFAEPAVFRVYTFLGAHLKKKNITTTTPRYA